MSGTIKYSYIRFPTGTMTEPMRIKLRKIGVWDVHHAAWKAPFAEAVNHGWEKHIYTKPERSIENH